METLLGKDGTYIDRIYYCPHHPDSGYSGEIKQLKIVCDCRKPEVGLIERAQRDFPIDMGASWVVGDSWRDIKLAANLELKSIQIITEGLSQQSVENPKRFTATSLTSALAVIKKYRSSHEVLNMHN